MQIFEAVENLIKVINKSRVHFYKPIQIAEVLYRDRVQSHAGLDLSKLDTYRTASRKWRDEKSINIVGRISTSSARYQDDVWNKNAVTPEAMVALSKLNKQNAGVVEAYVYSKINEKHSTLRDIFKYVNEATPESFDLAELILMFNRDAGLLRSMDKVFEITVYALFLTLTRALDVSIELKIGAGDKKLIKDFEAFTGKVYGLDTKELSRSLPAFVYRVGATNASDRGLDMWSTFGAAIQVKHLNLTEEIFDGISSDVTADRLIIVCREAESKIINNIFSKTGARSRVQAIVSLEELIDWYEKCLKTSYSKSLGMSLIELYKQEFQYEFPFVGDYLSNLCSERGYSLEEAGTFISEIKK